MIDLLHVTRTHSSRMRGGGGPPGTPLPPGPGIPRTRHPPVDRMTDRCKHITLPQTSFAGGKYEFELLICHIWYHEVGKMCTSLLDKIGLAVIGDFLLDQRYLILTVLLKYHICLQKEGVSGTKYLYWVPFHASFHDFS